MRRAAPLVGLLAWWLAGIASAQAGAAAVEGAGEAVVAPPAGDLSSSALEARIIEVAEVVKPSVVHIEAIIRVNDRRRQATGSGVIASPDGRILTNHHVVDRAEKVSVTIPGRKGSYPARILGTDKQTDIALLQIECDEPLPAARFADGDPLRVGQWVLAVGNPYGLDGTVSFGIVSAIGRNLEIPDTLNEFIQTDAMIDRGSSGGPLIDLEGRVIGINSRGQGRGIGFTIPIATVLDVAARLERGGIARGYLGITLQPLDRELADYFGIPDATGAVVNSVIEGSPAHRAGLEAGDIITAFNGVSIESEKDEDLGVFQRLVAGVEPGRRVEVAVLRGGRRRELAVKIGTQPSVEPEEAESELGFHVQEITEIVVRNMRLHSSEGAFVHFVAQGSPASEAGLRVGDVIERIEDERVADLEDFRRALGRAEGKQRFLITARRGEEQKFLLVKPGAVPVEPVEPETGEGEAALPAGTGER